MSIESALIQINQSLRRDRHIITLDEEEQIANWYRDNREEFLFTCNKLRLQKVFDFAFVYGEEPEIKHYMDQEYVNLIRFCLRRDPIGVMKEFAREDIARYLELGKKIGMKYVVRDISVEYHLSQWLVPYLLTFFTKNQGVTYEIQNVYVHYDLYWSFRQISHVQKLNNIEDILILEHMEIPKNRRDYLFAKLREISIGF